MRRRRSRRAARGKLESGRRGSNPRPSAWEGHANVRRWSPSVLKPLDVAAVEPRGSVVFATVRLCFVPNSFQGAGPGGEPNAKAPKRHAVQIPAVSSGREIARCCNQALDSGVLGLRLLPHSRPKGAEQPHARRPEARPDLRSAVHHHVPHVDSGVPDLRVRSRRPGRVHRRRRADGLALLRNPARVLPRPLERRDGRRPLSDREAAKRRPRDRLRRGSNHRVRLHRGGDHLRARARDYAPGRFRHAPTWPPR